MGGDVDFVLATYREIAAHWQMRDPDHARIKAKRAGWEIAPRNHPADPARVRVPRADWDAAQPVQHKARRPVVGPPPESMSPEEPPATSPGEQPAASVVDPAWMAIALLGETLAQERGRVERAELRAERAELRADAAAQRADQAMAEAMMARGRAEAAERALEAAQLHLVRHRDGPVVRALRRLRWLQSR